MVQVDRLQKGQIAAQGRYREAEFPPEVGDVDLLTGAGGQESDDVAHAGHVRQVGQLPHVLAGDGPDVVGKEVASVSRVPGEDRLGEPAPAYPFEDLSAAEDGRGEPEEAT